MATVSTDIGVGGIIGYMDYSARETATATNCFSYGMKPVGTNLQSKGILTNVERVYRVRCADSNITLPEEVSDTDGFLYNGVHYYKEGATVLLTVNLDQREGYAIEVKRGSTVVTPDDNGKYVLTTPGGNITVKAAYKPIAYTITCDLDGGTVGTANPESYTIESGDFTLANPTKDGYDFAGWTGTGLDSATMTVTIPQGSTGERSYTANWTPTVYTIIYSFNGSTADNPASYTIASADFKLTNPTKDGYTFTSWTGTDLDAATWTKNGFTPSDPNTPEFAYHSLILSGQIGVIFHVYVHDGASSKDYCMYFDVSGDKSQNTQPVYPFETLNEDGHQFFGFKCYINSVQMADEIHAVLNYGEGQTLPHTYTAKRYLDALIADTSQPEDVIELGRAIKDYGSYVQPILADYNNWEVGKKHAAMDFAYIYNESDFTSADNGTKEHAITCSIPDGSGIKNVTFALILDSETAIEIYLASKDGYTGNVVAHVGTNTTDNMAVKKGGEYVISIGNISAHKLGTSHTVSITTQYDSMEAVSFTVNVSALSYVQSAIRNDSTAMKRAITSLYRYWKATMTYRDNRPEIYGGGE